MYFHARNCKDLAKTVKRSHGPKSEAGYPMSISPLRCDGAIQSVEGWYWWDLMRPLRLSNISCVWWSLQDAAKQVLYQPPQHQWHRQCREAECLPLKVDTAWWLQRIVAFCMLLPKHFRPFCQASKNPTGLHLQGVLHHAERYLLRWSSGWIPICSCSELLMFLIRCGKTGHIWSSDHQISSDCCFIAMSYKCNQRGGRGL